MRVEKRCEATVQNDRSGIYRGFQNTIPKGLIRFRNVFIYKPETRLSDIHRDYREGMIA